MSDTVNQLQLLQQNLDSLLKDKATVEEQLFELNSAMAGISDSQKSFKIVGKVLIAKDSKQLQKELKDEHDQFELQMSEIEKQEQLIKEKMQKLQKDLLKEK